MIDSVWAAHPGKLFLLIFKAGVGLFQNAAADVMRSGAAECKYTAALKVENLAAHQMKNRVCNFVDHASMPQMWRHCRQTVKIFVIAVYEQCCKRFVGQPFKPIVLFFGRQPITEITADNHKVVFIHFFLFRENIF